MNTLFFVLFFSVLVAVVIGIAITWKVIDGLDWLAGIVFKRFYHE